MAEQYIFTIEALTKAYGKREVLKNIWLAFYPGAKIGVIGSNGAGKSSLLRVMAGEDKDIIGTARLTPGFSIGHVTQEPRLDESKNVLGNVEEAVASTRALLTRHEEISNKLGEPLDGDEMEKLLEELGKVQEQIDHVSGWELDRQLEIAMDAMRLPPATPRCSNSPAANDVASPCARSCCKSPTCCCWTSRPTISTPSRSPGWSGTCRSIPAPWSP